MDYDDEFGNSKELEDIVELHPGDFVRVSDFTGVGEGMGIGQSVILFGLEGRVVTEGLYEKARLAGREDLLKIMKVPDDISMPNIPQRKTFLARVTGDYFDNGKHQMPIVDFFLSEKEVYAPKDFARGELDIKKGDYFWAKYLGEESQGHRLVYGIHHVSAEKSSDNVEEKLKVGKRVALKVVEIRGKRVIAELFDEETYRKEVCNQLEEFATKYDLKGFNKLMDESDDILWDFGKRPTRDQHSSRGVDPFMYDSRRLRGLIYFGPARLIKAIEFKLLKDMGFEFEVTRFKTKTEKGQRIERAIYFDKEDTLSAEDEKYYWKHQTDEFKHHRQFPPNWKEATKDFNFYGALFNTKVIGEVYRLLREYESNIGNKAVAKLTKRIESLRDWTKEHIGSAYVQEHLGPIMGIETDKSQELEDMYMTFITHAGGLDDVIKKQQELFDVYSACLPRLPGYEQELAAENIRKVEAAKNKIFELFG